MAVALANHLELFEVQAADSSATKQLRTIQNMNRRKFVRISAIILSSLTLIAAVHAGDDKKTKVKPYTLDTCAVCGMKLADMGKPVTFEYKDREIKVCEKGEEKDFKKDPDKYLKKIDEAEAKAKK